MVGGEVVVSRKTKELLRWGLFVCLCDEEEREGPAKKKKSFFFSFFSFFSFDFFSLFLRESECRERCE